MADRVQNQETAIATNGCGVVLDAGDSFGHDRSPPADYRQAVNVLVGEWTCLTFRAGFCISTARQGPSTIKETASRLIANN